MGNGRRFAVAIALAIAVFTVGPARSLPTRDTTSSRAALDAAVRRIEAAADRIEAATRSTPPSTGVQAATSTTTSSTTTSTALPTTTTTPGPSPGAGLSETFDALPVGVPWLDGSVHGAWTSVFNGYGATQVLGGPDGNALGITPQAATSAGETHAGLVTTTESFADGEIGVRMTTLRQLRATAPNPWETAWLLWHYRDNQHFYYLALKPNGWELGKEDPAYPGSQRFLATGEAPAFPVGRTYDVRVTQNDGVTSVRVDGRLLTEFTDTERPYRAGRVGLYSEDAAVLFDDVEVTPVRQ